MKKTPKSNSERDIPTKDLFIVINYVETVYVPMRWILNPKTTKHFYATKAIYLQISKRKILLI